MEPNQYAWLCSKLTLQSDKRGFFQTFADSVTEIASGKWLEKFDHLSSDLERLSYCLKNDQVETAIQETLKAVEPVYRKKCEKMCEELAEAAEGALRKNDLIEAIRLANQAVARAPTTDIVEGSDVSYLIWALRIRSKVLEASCLWDLLLSDLQLILRQNPPSNIKDEAYLKMARCYLKKCDADKAKIALNVCRQRCETNKEILEVCQDLEEELNFIDKPIRNDNPEISKDANEMQLNGFVEGIDMVQSTDAGRSMIAKRPLTTGEIIAIESPYATVLLPDLNGTHCHHCFVRLTIFVPCTGCSGVAFCSIKCYKDAYVYHKFECNFLQLMIGSGMSVLCFLALRIITQHPKSYFTKLRNNIGDQICNHPYAKIYHLESHSKKRDAKSFFHRSLMALFLLQILKKSGYFTAAEDKLRPFSEEELFIGSLLLRNLQVLQYNAHEIYESVYKSRTDMKRSKTKYIGIAVYPKIAMLNHDCQPALARYFIGTKIGLRCIRPIETGENVTENYGPVFTMKTKEERQKSLLARYLFKCNCRPCQENWSTLENMRDSDIFVRGIRFKKNWFRTNK